MAIPNKIRTGFHRIGIVLMILPLLTGIGFLGFGTFLWTKPIIKPPRFVLTHEKYGNISIAYSNDPFATERELSEKLGRENVTEELRHVVGKAFSDVDRELSQASSLVGLGLGLITLGVAAYGVSWLIGWIICGFVG